MSASFSWSAFWRTRAHALEVRTEASALALLADYAETGCATYPEDSSLFRALWPDENPPGFTLHTYHHMNTHTVTGEQR